MQYPIVQVTKLNSSWVTITSTSTPITREVGGADEPSRRRLTCRRGDRFAIGG